MVSHPLFGPARSDGFHYACQDPEAQQARDRAQYAFGKSRLFDRRRANGFSPFVVSPSAEFTLSRIEGLRTGLSNHKAGFSDRHPADTLRIAASTTSTLFHAPALSLPPASMAAKPQPACSWLRCSAKALTPSRLAWASRRRGRQGPGVHLGLLGRHVPPGKRGFLGGLQDLFGVLGYLLGQGLDGGPRLGRKPRRYNRRHQHGRVSTGT